MKPLASLAGNFAHLKAHDEQLLRLGLLAERYFTEDPNTSLLKLRQLAELLAQHVATRIGLLVSAEESQYELIRRLLHRASSPARLPSSSAKSGALATREAMPWPATTAARSPRSRLPGNSACGFTVASTIPFSGVARSFPRRHLPTTSANFRPNLIA